MRPAGSDLANLRDGFKEAGLPRGERDHRRNWHACLGGGVGYGVRSKTSQVPGPRSDVSDTEIAIT